MKRTQRAAGPPLAGLAAPRAQPDLLRHRAQLPVTESLEQVAGDNDLLVVFAVDDLVLVVRWLGHGQLPQRPSLEHIGEHIASAVVLHAGERAAVRVAGHDVGQVDVAALGKKSTHEIHDRPTRQGVRVQAVLAVGHAQERAVPREFTVDPRLVVEPECPMHRITHHPQGLVGPTDQSTRSRGAHLQDEDPRPAIGVDPAESADVERQVAGEEVALDIGVLVAGQPDQVPQDDVIVCRRGCVTARPDAAHATLRWELQPVVQVGHRALPSSKSM